MRDDVDVVSFGPVGDFQRLGDAAHDAEVDAAVVDALVFDDFTERPLGPPVFSGGEWDVGLAAYVLVGCRIFRAHSVFDEEGFELFEFSA